jgi:sugar phosphate isomerase/epimerase
VHPRLSVSQVSSRNWSVEEDLAFYTERGVDRIGAWLPKLTATGDAMLAAELVAATDLRVTSLMAQNPFELGDRAGWETQAEALADALDVAELLRCDTVVIPFGSGGSMPWERSADALEEAIGPTLREAQRRGIWFLLELTNPLRTDISFVHSLRDALDLSWRLDTGVCMEITACWYERNLVGTIHAGVAGIGLVQLADYAVGTHDTPNRLVPGDGDLPLERVVGQLLETGYEGLFEIELIGPAIETEGYADAIDRAITWLDALFDRLGAGPPLEPDRRRPIDGTEPGDPNGDPTDPTPSTAAAGSSVEAEPFEPFEPLEFDH